MQSYSINYNKVIEYAEGERERLGDIVLGPKHLLLAILRIDGCAAVKVLRDNGVDLVAFRQAVEEMPQQQKPVDIQATMKNILLVASLAVKLRVLGMIFQYSKPCSVTSSVPCITYPRTSMALVEGASMKS